MVASLGTCFPRVYTITTDELDKLYKQIKSKGVTMTALLASSGVDVAETSTASYSRAGIQYRAGINIAVAVAMDDGGLITPVLQNADQVDIYSLPEGVGRPRQSQTATTGGYNSGTFTLSNLGMFGVDRFDAILPPGQPSWRLALLGLKLWQHLTGWECGNRCRLSPVTMGLSMVPLLQLSCKIWQVD